ncbi:ATP-binding cassette domain-containing protein [[Mycobacterium] burgundiense]|uniref:ATP-binding cassette domain-containing protein n=1 Tax=[Mycobacterium] burgundiense TaxID=3064286 RepID=A0ABM9LPL6_9MYCO|nr:ATP-binding cassette domain-containing protein [Mycolicibacterium sp. MU0053]CAJ1502613.1 ATP-binding cassette domain-containing protein [Mycolicibacterium sp. MU0053]
MRTSGSAVLTATAAAKRFDDAPWGPLAAVDLTARAGCVSLVQGPAGSGRTSLVRCLTGGYRLSAGDVTVRVPGAAAVSLAVADPRSVAWLRTHHIACFDGELVAAPTLPTAVAIARIARQPRAAAVAALSRLGAARLAAVSVGGLRAPQRRTAALVAALLADRDVVVLDDPEASAPVEPLSAWLQEAADGGAAVVVTAGTESALRPIAAAVGQLEEGRIAWV